MMKNNRNFIGLSKTQIIKSLNGVYVEFAHWLYIPALSLLLSFDKQCCVGADLV